MIVRFRASADGVAAGLRASWLARGGAAASLGAAMSLTQAPASLWPLAVLGPAFAFGLFGVCMTVRAAAWVGWTLGVGYFLPGLLWIGEAFAVDAEAVGWMRPFAVTLLPAYLALYWAAAFAAARYFAARWAEPSQTPRGAAFAAIALAAFWSLGEAARGYLFTGFPWGLIGYAWIDTPIAQVAAWLGGYGLNALTLVVATALGLAAFGLAGARRIQLAGCCAAVLLTLAAAGWARTAPAPTSEDAPLIRLVQPNVPQTEKWAPEHRERNLLRLIDLSVAGDDGAPRPEVIVWPETAVPFAVDRADELRAALMARLGDGVRLVLGSLRAEPRAAGGSNVYNSLMVVAPDGALSAVYDKHHLVPFGEFLPFQSLLQAIGVRQLAGRLEGFSSGPGPRTINIGARLRVTPLICYEAVFPQIHPPASNRPQLLLQITNDAWFGDSGGPRQHLAQSRFRAIEQGLPFFRSANTGITAAIDPYGRVIDSIGLNQQGYIDARPPAPAPPTLYARTGDWILAPLLLALFAGCVSLRRHSPRL